MEHTLRRLFSALYDQECKYLTVLEKSYSETSWFNCIRKMQLRESIKNSRLKKGIFFQLAAVMGLAAAVVAIGVRARK